MSKSFLIPSLIVVIVVSLTISFIRWTGGDESPNTTDQIAQVGLSQDTPTTQSEPTERLEPSEEPEPTRAPAPTDEPTREPEPTEEPTLEPEPTDEPESGFAESRFGQYDCIEMLVFQGEGMVYYDLGEADCRDALDMEGWGERHTRLSQSQQDVLVGDTEYYDQSLVDQTIRGEQSFTLPVNPGQSVELTIFAGASACDDDWDLYVGGESFEYAPPPMDERTRRPVEVEWIIPGDLFEDDEQVFTIVNQADDNCGRAGVWGVTIMPV